jgi:hypothetical protein
MDARESLRRTFHSRSARRLPTYALVGIMALLLAACPVDEDVVDEPVDEPEEEPEIDPEEEPEEDPDVAEIDYPEGPIELIVPWAAGGGTDAVARIVAELLSDELGETVNVVNRTGGGGAVGHSAIATGTPDGHTIGMATVEITMMHWMGLAEVTIDDMEPVGQVNLDPAGVTVRDDAEWQDINELIAYVEERGWVPQGPR